MRFLKIVGIILLFLIVLYFVGPKPERPKFTTELTPVPASIDSIQQFIETKESKLSLKPDNEARIIWFNDSSHTVTDYAVVYLHGFTASQEEGDPVHTQFAKKFGCNLFLSRLDQHGIDSPEPLLKLTAENLWNSAKEAYAIGKTLGKKVILMATSTGGTLALKLAAHYPDIEGLILLSPNIAIKDDNAWLLNNPWGLQIAKLVKGSAYNYSSDTTTVYKKYWYHKYRMESIVQLEELLETTMKESTFQKITQPVLLLYYFKNEEEQDDVVKVTAMKRMYNQLATPAGKKNAVAVPNAGDHVIGSYIKSKDIATVEKECVRFAKEILKLKEVKENN